eukprot:TRINITY_DN5266_c0_g1_i8.p1 TRINITY_DN5266_c0_g1~~TRINITY_DN5266_c0_g1_i8.p1  ORF type:complete len:132 (-),score=7.05 TRINITY_DN5266_c0_g1_i8:194-589(-)
MLHTHTHTHIHTYTHTHTHTYMLITHTPYKISEQSMNRSIDPQESLNTEEKHTSTESTNRTILTEKKHACTVTGEPQDGPSTPGCSVPQSLWNLRMVPLHRAAQSHKFRHGCCTVVQLLVRRSSGTSQSVP